MTIWRLLTLGAALVLAPASLAAQLDPCLARRQQRDDLAREAMVAELELVRQYRERICPQLNRAAEAANAETPGYDIAAAAAIDLQALRQCRQVAERQLERRQRPRYRNRLGFTFYTSGGAALAAEADHLDALLARQDCQGPS